MLTLRGEPLQVMVPGPCPFHSAALSDQGDVYAWGAGRYGATLTRPY